MDKDENFILGPATNQLEQYHIEVIDGAPEFVQDYAKEIPGLPPATKADHPMLQDTVVDWDGRIWFMVTDGRIGYFDPEADRIEMTDLEQGLQNSMVVDEDAIYFVTYESVFRLSVDGDGKIQTDWEASERRTTSSRSATTPTVRSTWWCWTRRWVIHPSARFPSFAKARARPRTPWSVTTTTSSS
jgi:streptogramin lyase